MKTFRFIGMALLATALNGTFTACSDDDDFEDDNEEASSSSSSPYSTEILGLWECYEMSVEGTYNSNSFDVGEKLKFLSSDVSYLYPSASWGVNGKKCFASEEDGMFLIHPIEYSNYYVNDPTEVQWNVGSEYDDYGTCVYFSNEIYVLNGDSLLIANYSNDWRRGAISIEDDVMIYTYVYQSGSYHTGKMSDDIDGPFISKFQRQ